MQESYSKPGLNSLFIASCIIKYKRLFLLRVMHKKSMLSNLIKGNFILCFKDFIIFEVKTFDVFCRAVLKRPEEVPGFMIAGNRDDLPRTLRRTVGCRYS